MNYLFNSFSKMLEAMPVGGVLPFARTQRQMFEADLLYHRVNENEVQAILTFCQFLESFKAGACFKPKPLPFDCIPFYRSVINRLIQAEELPYNAKEQFDQAFTSQFSRSLTH